MTTERNTTEAPRVEDRAGHAGNKTENSTDTCPAAELGRRIAALTVKHDAMDGRHTRARNNKRHREASVTERKMNQIWDEMEHLKRSLSFVKATSPDGAAVQIAYAMTLREELEDFDPEKEGYQHKIRVRAFDRLTYSAISHLQDRVEADCGTNGVDCMASSLFDPWISVDAVLNGYRDLDELSEREAVAAE